MSKEHYDPNFYRELGQGIRKQILQAYREDSCIATTSAAVTALRLLRIDAFPLSVEVAVVNNVLYRYAEGHGGEFPVLGTEGYPEGGYGVGVTQHVVAIAERRWLLDYSIDQATREERGIVLEPLVIPVEEKWLRGKWGHLVFRHGTTILYYSARPGDRWFEESNNWKGDGRPGVHLREQKSEGDRVRSKRRLLR